jgi:CheY-like chemotaxis protein
MEEGAPPRGPITRRGFGTDLIEGKIPYELSGTGKITIEPGGARCHLEFPLKEGESILETDSPVPTTIFGGTLDMSGAPDLSARTVLVVEDDYYLAGDTAAALRGAGATVLGPCPSEDATLDLLESNTPTHAVLDLNLGGGGPRFKIAHALRERGVPFVFLTGYDSASVPADLADVVRLQKPLPLRDIVEAVATL